MVKDSKTKITTVAMISQRRLMYASHMDFDSVTFFGGERTGGEREGRGKEGVKGEGRGKREGDAPLTQIPGSAPGSNCNN